MKIASGKKWIMAITAVLMVCVCAYACAQSYSLGDEANEIETIQTALKKLKLYSGNITGHYGEKTMNAVKTFQKRNDLEDDGIAGEATIQALYESAGITYSESGSGSEEIYTSDGTLRHGSRSEAVRQMQEDLKALGYYTGSITGNFGTLTEAAVMKFQRANNLSADGIAGAKTLAKIAAKAKGSSSGSGSSSSGSTSSGSSSLRYGVRSEAVRQMQQDLKDLGYYTGSVTGNYGNLTKEAVYNFQRSNNLSADGIAGSKTLTLLYSGDALDASQAPEMDYLLLVNRENKLDKNFAPTDLVEIADVIPDSVLKVKYKGTRANRVATEALYRMLEDAIADGIGDWQVSSAYRGYSDQQALVDQSVNKYKKNNPDWSRERCLSATYQTVAPAGTSEHMTGLAFDITVPGVSFSGTRQQKWLHEHCYEYGFVVRFTEDKQDKTGFLAESWHFRYVGLQAAQVMAYNNWCLEEYVEKMK